MNLDLPTDVFSVDIGKASVYVGEQYEYEYFFESSSRKMMKPMGVGTIDFRTYQNEYFQFSLDTFHNNKCLLLTSTLGDCAFFGAPRLSLDKSIEYAKHHSAQKHTIKNSYSGYFTFGKKLLKQYETLKKHLKEQHLYLTDDALEKIYKELKRRAEQ